jgi:hypothetical protein
MGAIGAGNGPGSLGQGGGADNAGAAADARNTIVGLNQASQAPDFSGNFTAASHNLLEDGTGSNLPPGDPGPNGNLVGTAAHPIDPMLGPLARNGGPTRTMALLPGSPAIDAGTSRGAPPTDQRGQPRGTPPDIGAYETPGPEAPALALPVGVPTAITVAGPSATGQREIDRPALPRIAEGGVREAPGVRPAVHKARAGRAAFTQGGEIGTPIAGGLFLTALDRFFATGIL